MSNGNPKLNSFLVAITLLCAALLIGEYSLLKRIDQVEDTLSTRLHRLNRLAANYEEYRALRVVPPGKRDVLYPAQKTFRPGVDTLSAFQARLRTDLRRWIGLDEERLGRPVTKRVIETQTLDSLGVVREQVEVAFEGNDSWYLRGYLLYPLNAAGSLPGVLCLNGHSGRARAVAGLDEDYSHAYGLGLAQAGCKVLTFDWCFEGDSHLADDNGKLYSAHDSLFSYVEKTGRTGLALYMENAYCALKALRQEPQVDAGRLGVTGISRGGELTTYFAALFAPEIAAYYASGAGFPFVYRAFGGGCQCTYVEDIFANYEFSDLMIAAAPLPAKLQLGVKDDIWGYWDNIELILTSVRPVYGALGATNLVGLDIHQDEHVYNVPLSVAFFKKYLIDKD
ncbi:MAG TPA: hypothetical protein VJ417_02325 [Candidatus Glassbacteria bacterium]|nr:hypothetical protein [Candidatus Glassbacteria bacterium]